MKVVLEYELPKDQTTYNHSLKGSSYFSALKRFHARLENLINSDEVEDDKVDIYDEIRTIYSEILNDFGILDEIDDL